MKKTILITVGILVILIIIAVWVYLFMFGKPNDAGEVFARFGFSGDSTGGEVVPQPTQNAQTPDSVVNTAPAKLRQLTTRPVAGAVFTESGIMYVEQGTGHVYEINLQTGEELLVSGTTIPQTTHATFSSDAATLTITSLTDSGTETIIGTIETDPQNGGQIDAVALPTGATEIAISEEGDSAYYLMKNQNGSVGYRYSIEKETSTEVFNIPLRDIHVLWGTPTYVYTTPTSVQTGFVYKIGAKNQLDYVTKGLKGLTAFPFKDGIAVSSITKGVSTNLVITTKGEVTTQALPFIPEKCSVNTVDGSYVFCAVPTNLKDGAFPDDWYMGTRSYNDTLWSMDSKTGEATFMLDFLAESGREMDVHTIGVHTGGMLLYFINKNDNTLWMYDRNVE